MRDWDFGSSAFGRHGSDPPDQGSFVPNEVFVVMAFTPDLDDSFRAIQEGCADRGLRANRADDGVGSGIILDQITQSIREAEFVVVDLTHERPNVYYELGYAHGVGNLGADVLLVARAGTMLHFDISSLRVRFYSSPANLRTIVSEALMRMIHATRSYSQGGYRPANGGLFSLSFETTFGNFTGGLALLRRGIIQGGDESYLYTGRYRPTDSDGSEIAGELQVKHYRGTTASILGPLVELQLPFTGKQLGDDFVAEAKIPGRSMPPVRVRGRRVAAAIA